MGVLAGLSGAAGTGCATTGSAAKGSLDPAAMPDMDAFLSRLDHSMESIASGSPLRAFFRDDPRRPHEQLVKKSLRSLLIAGSFRDLSEEQRAHPGMQQRMRDAMSEMDEAVFGMTHVLARYSPDERVRIREVLNEDPELGMRIAESLDGDAVSAGVSAARRLHLRTLSSQLTFRLKHQPVTTLIDEYVGKVQKVAARHGYTEELQRRIAAKVVSGSLLGMPPEAVVKRPPPEDPKPVVPAEVPPEESTITRKKPTPGKTPISVGALLMGVGTTISLISLGAAAATSSLGLLFAGFTIGAAILLAGLILLVAGLAIWASAD